MSGGQLPKRPVLGWSSFAGRRSAGEAGVLDLPSQALVTSGRAALYHALRQLDLRPGTAVLVPTYHCPTMIAPVVCAKLQPVFYGIGEDGLPLVSSLERAATRTPKAMIVAHFFGLPQSLRAVREYCDAHGIALIEDCAHALFGMAGDRPVGAWGDFATASLTKFLPVAELGLLASATRTVTTTLECPSTRQQIKAAVDILERASLAGRPAGLSTALRLGFSIKTRAMGSAATTGYMPRPCDLPRQEDLVTELVAASDMGRVITRATAIDTAVMRAVPLNRIVKLRRARFDQLSRELRGMAGIRPLSFQRTASAVPYAFPLWIEKLDRAYAGLREKGWPIYRWDRLWPGAEGIADDAGIEWSRHVLQLLCHQDLSADDVEQMAHAVREAVH